MYVCMGARGKYATHLIKIQKRTHIFKMSMWTCINATCNKETHTHLIVDKLPWNYLCYSESRSNEEWYVYCGNKKWDQKKVNRYSERNGTDRNQWAVKSLPPFLRIKICVWMPIKLKKKNQRRVSNSLKCQSGLIDDSDYVRFMRQIVRIETKW